VGRRVSLGEIHLQAARGGGIVEVDPARKILLDVNFANNSYQRDVAAKPLLKWWRNLLFWAQNLLLAAGGVS